MIGVARRARPRGAADVARGGRSLLGVEWRTQLSRPLTRVTLAALGVFPVVLAIALLATGDDRVEHVGDIPLLIVPRGSPFSIAVIALSSTMKFFLPLAVAVFAGEAVAGEAQWGSLRHTLARGVSRSRLLLAKAGVAAGLSLLAVVLVPVAAVVAGVIAYGWQPLVAGDGSTAGSSGAASFDAASTLLRLGVATAYVAVGMASIFAVSLFLSTVVRRPLLAVAGGVGLTILSRVLNADYLPGVAALNGYMPNNDVDLWQHLFQDPVQPDGMLHFLVLQVVYAGAFLGAAWWWFSRKDVVE